MTTTTMRWKKKKRTFARCSNNYFVCIFIHLSHYTLACTTIPERTHTHTHTHTHIISLYYYYTISPRCSVIVPTIYTFSIIYLSSDDQRIPPCVYLLSHLPQTLTIYVHIKPRNLCDTRFYTRPTAMTTHYGPIHKNIGSERPPPPRGLQIVFKSKRVTENTILHIYLSFHPYTDL